MPAREKARSSPVAPAAHVDSAAPHPARRWLGSRVTTVVLLTVFWAALLLAWRGKGLTDDEGNHALGGYTYWKFGDYRINPENGNLPQRVAGLALVLADVPPPLTNTPAWRKSDEWFVSHGWIFDGGIDVDAFLRTGRAGMSVLAVALVALAWAWSRRLFGAEGGNLTLLLCVFSPMLLANGPLITSDIAASLFFLAAVGAYWRLLHRVTAWTTLLSGAATAGLFLSKMSAVLLVPIAGVLLIARLASAAPLSLALPRPREVAARGRRAAILFAATVAQALVAWLLIWGAYGFRYSAFARELDAGSRHAKSFEHLLGYLRPYELIDELQFTDAQTARAVEVFRKHEATSDDWTTGAHRAMDEIARDVLTVAQRPAYEKLARENSGGLPTRLIEFSREHRLLPEAFLVGTAHARSGADARISFLDGEVRPTGRPDYFPRTLLYKNPAAVFGVVLLALGAAVAVGRNRDRGAWRAALYAALPLVILLVVYWAVLLRSGLNIGHRHALPAYAPCFILAGAAAWWWQRERRGPLAWPGALLGGLLGLLVIEVGARWPNYTGFFSAVFGGPSQGYRHLADSSIEWGQSLPAVKRFLDRTSPTEPVYFSYFGNDSPRRRGIQATLLPSFGGWDNDRRPVISYHTIPAAERREFLARLATEQPEREVLAEAESERGYECAVVKRASSLRLTAGVYLISAPMLPALDLDAVGLLGTWCERHEREYQEARAIVVPLLVEDATAARQALLDRLPIDDIAWAYRSYEQFRFRRLTAWLRRNRAPDEVIAGGGVLVYRLTAANVQEALEGPPPEMGPDLFTEHRDKLLRELRAKRGE